MINSLNFVIEFHKSGKGNFKEIQKSKFANFNSINVTTLGQITNLNAANIFNSEFFYIFARFGIYFIFSFHDGFDLLVPFNLKGLICSKHASLKYF